MTDYTLSTGISRRSMLLGSVLAPSLTLPLLAAHAALPKTTLNRPGHGADAELFRRIVVAERWRNEHARARRLRDRRRAAMDTRIDLPPLPWRGPFRHSDPLAWLHCAKNFERYAKAVRAAVAVPAHTIAGVHAKLALATIASRRGGARVYMYEDREWLETVLADLERLTRPTFSTELRYARPTALTSDGPRDAVTAHDP